MRLVRYRYDLRSSFFGRGGYSHGCISKGLEGSGYGTSNVTRSANNTNIAGSKIWKFQINLNTLKVNIIIPSLTEIEQHIISFWIEIPRK